MLLRRIPLLSPTRLTAEMTRHYLSEGLTDFFLFGTDGATSIVNRASAINASAANATVVGSPTYGAAYARCTSGAYFNTSARETANYTCLSVMRINNAGARLGVTWASTYALDASVNNGATKFGALGIITQTGAADYTGAISNRIGYAKPHASAPAITYVNPSLSIADTRTWKLAGCVVHAAAAAGDGGGSQITDLTNSALSSKASVGSTYYRLPNSASLFRIGCDNADYFNGSIDIAAWFLWNRVLSSDQLQKLRAILKPYFHSRGISI